ncbi:MAG TPA: EpsG family protein [Oscillospiraceae bacterium]|nr:EpsG family protein [Oscillospiraceae bacterium]HPK35198.1 EpsG family protein [Oscillospiraceae bacterium]HPR75001.1 EpsG family protein [Oscillospiraceae bacterium]
MSPYLIVYGFLLIFAAIAFLKKKDYNLFFIASAVVLTLFLALRYGQGSDYFAYMRLYEEAPGGIISIQNFWGKNENVEIGWKLLEAVFQAIKAPFWVFIGAIGAASMLLLVRFAVKCCPGARTFALLLAYPTLYLTYLVSGIRQGLTICVFLGLMLPFLLEKKYWQYFAVGIACLFIHKASFIVLFAPIVLFLSQKAVWWILSGCAAAGVVVGIPFVSELLQNIAFALGKRYTFNGITDISWIALAERLVTFAVIAFVYWKYKRENEDKTADLVFKIYCYGLGVYLLLMSAPMIASRMMFPLKMAEIMLAGIFIVKMPKWRYPVFLFFVALTAVMTWKNIGSYIDQGIYNCKIVNYPYVTVLQNQETIFEWRDPQGISDTVIDRKLAQSIGVPEQYLPEEKEEIQ